MNHLTRFAQIIRANCTPAEQAEVLDFMDRHRWQWAISGLFVGLMAGVGVGVIISFLASKI